MYARPGISRWGWGNDPALTRVMNLPRRTFAATTAPVPRHWLGPALAWLLRSLFAVVLIAGAVESLAGGRTPVPVIEPARAGTQCIADAATMRRDHPAMLEHQRDQTVRGGIRGAKASLKACIACHASPVKASVVVGHPATGAGASSVASAPTNFCVSCHSYTAVRIDCFECHAASPKAMAVGARRP